MRRLVFPVAIVLFLALLLPAPALGAADDDIPGVTLGGSKVSDSVNPTSDHHDVFSIVVGAGQEIHVKCVTKTGSEAKGNFR